MGWEASGVVGFHLGSLVQGQKKIAKVKSAYKLLIFLLVIEVWDGKPTYKKSWSGNLLVCSDLTSDPSFKVKTRIAKVKSVYNLHIIGPRGCLGW